MYIPYQEIVANIIENSNKYTENISIEKKKSHSLPKSFAWQ